MAKTRVLIASLIAVTAVASIGIAAEDIYRVIIVGAGMSGSFQFCFPYEISR